MLSRRLYQALARQSGRRTRSAAGPPAARRMIQARHRRTGSRSRSSGSTPFSMRSALSAVQSWLGTCRRGDEDDGGEGLSSSDRTHACRSFLAQAWSMPPAAPSAGYPPGQRSTRATSQPTVASRSGSPRRHRSGGRARSAAVIDPASCTGPDAGHRADPLPVAPAGKEQQFTEIQDTAARSLLIGSDTRSAGRELRRDGLV